MIPDKGFPNWFEEPSEQEPLSGTGPRPNGQDDTSQKQKKGKAKEWLDPPEPQSVSGALEAVKPFDPQLLPESFRDFTDDASERMQVPPDAIAIPLVVGASSAVGRRTASNPKN